MVDKFTNGSIQEHIIPNEGINIQDNNLIDTDTYL